MINSIYYFDISSTGIDMLGNKDIYMLLNSQAVKKSVQNLINTEPYTALMEPNKGINLYQYIFLPIDEFGASMMQDDIYNGINNAETRIKNLIVKVTPNIKDLTYIIDIIFTIGYDSQPQQLKLDFKKLRG